MSSAKPIDLDIQTEHLAEIMNFQAKDWLSAEAAAQPLASQSMGSQEGSLGSHIHDAGASMRRPSSLRFPEKQASKTVFALTEGDSPVDSMTVVREQPRVGGMAQPKLPPGGHLSWCRRRARVPNHRFT
eukprot:5469415-Pyramimonas_sp.AAC.1